MQEQSLQKSSVPAPYDVRRGNYSIFAFVLIPVSFLQSSVNLDAPCWHTCEWIFRQKFEERKMCGFLTSPTSNVG